MTQETELQTLEKRINELLATCQFLSEQNNKLEQQKQQLAEERMDLIYRKNRSLERIQSVLGRLNNL